MKRPSTIPLTALGLLCLVVACGIVDSPESAAGRWFDAGLKADGQTLGELTCEAQQEQQQANWAMLSLMRMLGQPFLGGHEVEADTSRIKFTTISNDGTNAQVRVTGTVRVSILAMWENEEVDDTWYMVHEGGQWKWCGSQSQAAW